MQSSRQLQYTYAIRNTRNYINRHVSPPPTPCPHSLPHPCCCCMQCILSGGDERGGGGAGEEQGWRQRSVRVTNRSGPSNTGAILADTREAAWLASARLRLAAAATSNPPPPHWPGPTRGRLTRRGKGSASLTTTSGSRARQTPPYSQPRGSARQNLPRMHSSAPLPSNPPA
jgi:streptolysin S family bacteriocin protoxin